MSRLWLLHRRHRPLSLLLPPCSGRSSCGTGTASRSSEASCASGCSTGPSCKTSFTDNACSCKTGSIGATSCSTRKTDCSAAATTHPVSAKPTPGARTAPSTPAATLRPADLLRLQSRELRPDHSCCGEAGTTETELESITARRSGESSAPVRPPTVRPGSPQSRFPVRPGAPGRPGQPGPMRPGQPMPGRPGAPRPGGGRPAPPLPQARCLRRRSRQTNL